MCWLRSVTRITDLCQLIGISLLAAFLRLESFGYIVGRLTMSSKIY
ncbi:hypothetical protein yrohd0001_9160 [Yersinia rohdei ATCC 43380]|nr:hypothetical protein yrohd0001_9160 [Yersinia rohdei ATCC 43380]